MLHWRCQYVAESHCPRGHEAGTIEQSTALTKTANSRCTSTLPLNHHTSIPNHHQIYIALKHTL